MALEEDTVEKNEHGLPFKNEFDYDALYFWTSHFVHATVVAVLGHACQRGQVFKVRARGRVTQKQGENALVNAVVFLSKGFVCGCRAMNEEQLAPVKNLVGVDCVPPRYPCYRRSSFQRLFHDAALFFD